jgi:hypothetical protein
MAYCDFTLPDIKRQLHCIIDATTDLFTSVGEVRGSHWLQETLRETLPLALAVPTEKSRSALLIAPILVALRKLAQHQVSLFSGIDFSVDPGQGLNGVCDFIVSQSPEQLFVSAPVLIVVEAKNENIKEGLAQCIAAMIAARLFNDQEGSAVAAVLMEPGGGDARDSLTTKKGRPLQRCMVRSPPATNWRFLKLEPGTVYINQREYYIDRVEKILGILGFMMIGISCPVRSNTG